MRKELKRARGAPGSSWKGIVLEKNDAYVVELSILNERRE
jgi:hypothetical protein